MLRLRNWGSWAAVRTLRRISELLYHFAATGETEDDVHFRESKHVMSEEFPS